MKIGYSRVSTQGQDLKTQINKLTDYGCNKVFSEKISGKSTEQRKELQKALEFVREGDSLVVTRLDRLARSVVDLGQIAELLQSKGVNLVVTDQSIDTTSASGKLMFYMISAFAEFERDLINERCAEGREKALANGVKFGRKSKLTPKQVDTLKSEFSSWEGSKTDLAEKYGISRASLYRLVQED
ncbi:recombinase family protein [Kangiella aquimarina]|uniref:Recombinase family protein n=1 Tax=Kangiella aquimarina TaxID=261965 RepID=A0ABZ0X6G1_9GAMM|nr:recombinase family protein [Kangiella aquimarina]WQG86198.1 recombinase family protein [Kangiella aquimarina]